MKKILPVLILLLALYQQATAKEAILQLDTGGHTGLMRDVIVTKLGDIITASDDKTIRVWDSSTGREKRKILGQIGKGSEGKIYAIVLSPDEKWLAVGGFLAGTHAIGERFGIRIYNYSTGELIKVLKSHNNVVLDLAFDRDGRYLISGSSDTTAKIWSATNFKLLDTITFHTKHVQAVNIIKKSDTYLAITVGYDNKIALYDIKKRKIIANKNVGYKLLSLATTDKHIAVCGKGKEIRIYNYRLKLLHTIESETKPAGLSYSPDGKLLIAGRGSRPNNVNIYNKQKNYTLLTSFQKHTNLTKAVAFLNNTIAISAGGTNYEIYQWDSQTAKVKNKIEGVGATVWSVGVKGDVVVWGNKLRNVHNDNSWNVEKTLNLKKLQVGLVVPSNFNRIATTKGNLTLSYTRGGEYGTSDATLILKKNQKEISRITKSSRDGLGHRCYGFYKDSIISGGAGQLKIYNFKGDEIADLVGHTGEVLSIALDGDRLVSGSSDQTIRIWDLSKLKVKDEEPKIKITQIKPDSIADHAGLNVGDIIYSVDNKKFKSSEEYIKYTKPLKSYIFYFVRNEKKMKLKVNKTEKSFGLRSKDISIQVIEPQLNIFVSKDNEWVVWSKNGYYNASVEGDKYIGYHINQGTDKEAYFVSSDKYADTYYRPDIIDAIIGGSSEKRAIESSSTRVATVDVVSSLPPMLSLLSPSNVSTDSSRIIVKFTMKSSAEVEKVIVTRNGQSLSSRGLEKTRDGTRSMIEVELEDGENIISIRAKNKFALSDELLVNATKTSQSETIYKPKLYLLTIGVSQYENKDYNLAFADKDAKSIAEMFAYQEGKLYKEVVTKSLLNEQATKDNILDALDWIERETTQRDVVVIFSAGHGQNDYKGNFYFLSHDADAQNLRKTSIKWTEIKDTITSLPSKVILILDACHSGNIMGKGRRRDITGAIKSIINSGTGAIILTASTGRGYSIEDKKWGHGAFTKAILEGLGEGKADYNQNDTIEIKEIDLYVTDRVKELTDGRQKPRTIIPQSVPNFAIGVR